VGVLVVVVELEGEEDIGDEYVDVEAVELARFDRATTNEAST